MASANERAAPPCGSRHPRVSSRWREKRIGLFHVTCRKKCPGEAVHRRWISRLGAPLIAFVLTVAPSISPVHAVEDARKVSVVSFGLFGDQGVFRAFPGKAESGIPIAARI